MGQIFNRRRATKGHQAIPYGAVDLGLPSGLLWAQGNIVKDANGNYSMGSPTDLGCYFSWGNIDGHPADVNEDGYSFNASNYSNSPGYQLTTDIASNDAQHDAALAHLGSPWRLPTKKELDELKNYTDREYITIDGVEGRKLMKKSDHSVFIFLPSAGQRYNRLFYSNRGRYWTSKFVNETDAYGLYFSSGVFNISTLDRAYGFTIRAVCSPNT